MIDRLVTDRLLPPESPLGTCTCDHPMDEHAFFPGPDGKLGEPAPLCIAAYRPDDATLIDHVCECEGFIAPLPHGLRDGRGYRVYLEPDGRYFDLLKFLKPTRIGLEFATRQGAIRYLDIAHIHHVEEVELPKPGAW